LRKLLFLPAILLYCGYAVAQPARPDFTGTWKLNIPKSTKGEHSLQDVSPNLVYTETIAQSKDSIAITTKADGAANPMDGTYAVNGKFKIEKLGNNYHYIKVGWEGSTLVFEISDRDSKKETAKYLSYIRESWILSPDGKVLTEFRRTATPQEKKVDDQKYMFDKQ